MSKFEEWYKREINIPMVVQHGMANKGWNACKKEVLNLILKEQKEAKKDGIRLCMLNINYLKEKIEKL